MESYQHKLAKELLYSEIIQKQKFHYKLTSDEWSIPIEENDHVYMECPACFGEIDSIQSIKKQGCFYPAVFCNNSNNPFYCDDYLLPNGVCRCNNCDLIDYKKIIIHDIAVVENDIIQFAIEIINKHRPQWLSKREPSYRVYLINAKNVLQRVSDTAVYVNSFTTKKNRPVKHEKEI